MLSLLPSSFRSCSQGALADIFDSQRNRAPQLQKLDAKWCNRFAFCSFGIFAEIDPRKSATVRRSSCAGFSVDVKPRFHDSPPTQHDLAIFRIAKVSPGEGEISDGR
jgi:hypothetical protein